MKRTVEYEREVAKAFLENPICRNISRRNWYPLFKFEISEIYTDWARVNSMKEVAGPRWV